MNEPSHLLEITTLHQSSGSVVIVLTGDLDISSVDDLNEAVVSVEQSSELVVLDLRNLCFLDSSGLRSIVLATERLQSQGGRLALIPGPDRVQRLFDLTGLSSRLTFVSACP